MNPPKDYAAGAEMMLDIVGRFRELEPLFALPPKNVALIASVLEVGRYIARNQAARTMLLAVASETHRRSLPEPTVMMLRVALEHHGIEPLYVPLASLGIPGELVPMGRGGSS